MRSITVRTQLNADEMKLSYSNTRAIVTVGKQCFEFDLQSLWDLAKSAIRNSTDSSPSMERRQLEVKATDGMALALPKMSIAGRDYSWYECSCCREYFIYCIDIQRPTTCTTCIQHDDMCYSHSTNPGT